MSAHRHLAQDALLQAALEGPPELRAELQACPTCAPQLAELAAFLATCRTAAAVRDAEPARAEALAERVLARTTREDPSWRGDLRLLRGFVSGRLRTSRVLRFAAASLVAHLLALPVFAWLAFQAPPRERHFTTGFEHREPRLPDVPMEPERTPRVEEPEPEPRLLEADLRSETERRRDAAAARRAERERLLASAPPEPGAQSPRDPVARLLWARARVLAGAGPPPAEGGPGAGAVELALAAEAQLDHLILSGERLADLDVTLRRLSAARPEGRPEAALVALTLARAARAGVLWDPDARALQARLAALDLPLDETGAAEAWARALTGAVRGRGEEARAAAAAWSAWGR